MSIEIIIPNYNGFELIKKNPFGVGLGNQVIYSVKNNIYQNSGMVRPWEWQPIHNIYLLMASEIGIFGFLAFSFFILNLFGINQYLSKDFGSVLNLENYIPKIMLLALLAFGLVDHFLWTLEPGRLMLWVVVGVVMGSHINDHDYKIKV